MKKHSNQSIKHSISFISLIIILLSLSTACTKTEVKQPVESEYKIYYIDIDETQVVSESYTPVDTEPTALIEEFLVQLQNNPKNLSYKKAKPDTVTFKEYKLTKEGQLTLDFDGNYKTLTSIKEVLCRTAIVKTLFQVEGVEYIEFYVNGQPLMNMNEKPIGFMVSNEFIDNTGREINYKQDTSMTLYFTNKAGDALVETRINKIYDGTIPMEQLIIEQLIKGPSVIKGTEKDSLYPTIPSTTTLIKVITKDGVCYVDLSKKFLDKLSDITNEVAIYSIVNSLAEMPTINKVKFLIDGEEQKTYREKIAFDGYFERNLDLIVSQKKSKK